MLPGSWQWTFAGSGEDSGLQKQRLEATVLALVQRGPN